MKKITTICLLLIMMFINTSCMKLTKIDEQSVPLVKSSFIAKKTLVMPFKDIAKIYGVNVTVKSPLSGNYFKTGKIEEETDNFMNESLAKIAKDIKEFGVVSFKSDYNNISERSELDSLIKIGKEAGVDKVLAGYIYKFTDRVGSDYSVDTSASVTFNIYLIDVKEGSIIRSGYFDETQQPLSENLFSAAKFFKRECKWITAKDMAYSGIEDILKKFL